MENTIQINKEYNSLDKLLVFLNKETPLECSKEYDHWEVRTGDNGAMEECLLIKKSAMHGVKLFFMSQNTVKVNYVIPNKIMHAYFGKSEKAHQNILEIITGIIKQVLLSTSQKTAFYELEKIIKKAA